jgi:hypothetical protein
MEKEVLPYDRALKLKDLGFCEPCFGYHYTLNGKDWKFTDTHKYHEIDDILVIGSKFTLLAPTFQQAFRWFRKKHGLDSFCRQTTLDGRSYFKISKIETDEIIKGYSNFTTTYEAAELAALDKLIEIIETKQPES